MTRMDMRPHQVEAVDSALRFLSVPPGGTIPAEGLRTQIIAATGSGKTLMATEVANRLSARRVLVLVPTLDLLTQMARAWRAGGRRGAMVGVCRLPPGQSDGIPCTTSPDELIAWTAGTEPVTVFATYASVGLRILQRAHEAGLPGWDLLVADEAHRTSGDAGRPWAAVHDQAQIPAVRRLYMTATARVWEAEGQAPRLVASMDEDSPVFGPVAYKLKLSDAIRMGLVAPYQVLCLDIRDPQVWAALQAGDAASDAVRGARLGAIATGMMRAAVQERFRRVLSFHSRVAEAEAMTRAVPSVAARLDEDEPGEYPPPGQVWADWLYGDHRPAYRREVLDEFASDFLGGEEFRGRDVPAKLRVLCSVRVLGEGVDTAECDAVLFSDARGSMVDIVQMVGRALRKHPGQGKIATLIVPVFLGPDEDPNQMVTSDAYGTLAKVLGALRAHDTETIEALADPRPRSSRPNIQPGGEEGGLGEDVGDVDEDQELEDEGAARVSAAAAGVLKFSEERDPTALSTFIRLRLIDPERVYWRRGIEAAQRWLRETGETASPVPDGGAGSLEEMVGRALSVPVTYVTPVEWGAVGSYPLGAWLADQRRYYAAGTLEAVRVAELEKLGMVWSVYTAWDDMLEVARSYADAHGHLVPPATAVWEGQPVGTWLKNQRAAARKAVQNVARRAAGETGVPATGELPERRREALEAIDAGWCPVWDAGWQRVLRLCQAHRRAGAPLPEVAGGVIVQGEDLGAWAAAQRSEWERLMPAQQYLLETLGLEPAPAAEAEAARPVGRREQARAVNLAAARQFFEREGHLRVPRKHVEVLPDGTEIKLGAVVDNTRRRADKLTDEQRAEWTALGMRW
ncbi:Helicase associated domain protein [Streptomyces sp. NPDC021356]|uniref:DEAD/DEAH box helicase n=1 Tax=Streptomyces sp. NPDC021356 TaxID=3154900 RepID=UPI0034065134